MKGPALTDCCIDGGHPPYPLPTDQGPPPPLFSSQGSVFAHGVLGPISQHALLSAQCEELMCLAWVLCFSQGSSLCKVEKGKHRLCLRRDDLVNLYIEALQNSSFNGTYNATAPNPVRMSELCSSLGRVLGRPSWLPVPEFALQVCLQPWPFASSSFALFVVLTCWLHDCRKAHSTQKS